MEGDRKLALFLPRRSETVVEGDICNVSLTATVHQRRGQILSASDYARNLQQTDAFVQQVFGLRD